MSMKETLNLPKTDFPMKANLPNREPKFLQKWQDTKVYENLRNMRKGATKFIMHDGPPYANGDIHIGHVLNKTLKDIVIKSKSLSGYDAPMVPGWDCHGLPIELKVEKKLGKPGKKVDTNTFRKACREYANSQINAQREQFIRLGGFASWYNPYLLMDKQIESDTLRALAKLVKGGFLKKGDKPVHWCFDCQSSLAEAEVEYEDKKSSSIDVKFQVVDTNALVPGTNLSISAVIWTTTPWSLSANQAVSIHPDYEYALVQVSEQEGYVLASELVEPLMSKWDIQDYKILQVFKAKSLEKVMLKHPFESRAVPMVLSEHVTLDAGTGLVHTAPSHGVDDYNVCSKYSLPVIHMVGPNGCYVSSAEYFAGMHVFKATKDILELLQQNGNLVFADTLEHSYPHCWRHKTPVIYRATPQWFVNLSHENLREKALAVVAKNQWFPSWGKNRMQSMLEGRPDWCISRQQRVWGVPMALVINAETGDLHPDIVNIMEQAALLVEKGGIEAWFECSLSDLGVTEDGKYIKSDDSLDVWFVAGVTHESVLAKNPLLGVPADLYLEGSDQHRGWFQSSLLTSVALREDAPYKAVLTHGYTVDANGRKMSKSLGNVVSPDNIIKSLGADILRLWVAATDYQKDVSISDEILKRIADAYRRIRNTIRYLLSNLYDFDYQQHAVDLKQMLDLDKYILMRTKELQEAIIKDYDSYQFHHIYQKLHNFCTIDLGGFYLDIIKDRQYTMQKDSLGRRSCQTAIYHIAQSMVRWIAPILSFTAEEMWEHLNQEQESVFYVTWYDKLSAIKQDSIDTSKWDFLIELRDEVNKCLEEARNNNIIGAALEAEVNLYCNEETYKLLAEVDSELHFIFITSKVHLNAFANKGQETAIDGLRVEILQSPSDKCIRCWHRRQDVGENEEYSQLCQRCVDNVYSNGEIRKIA